MYGQYEVTLNIQGEAIDNFFTNKRDLIRWIASETEVTQVSIASEIDAKSDSVVSRDSQGWRAHVNYVTYPVA